MRLCIHCIIVPFVCPVGENVKVYHDDIQGMHYREICSDFNGIPPVDSTQDALLGKMRFDTKSGRFEHLNI